MPKLISGRARRAGYRETVHVLATSRWSSIEELVAFLYGVSLEKLTEDVRKHRART